MEGKQHLGVFNNSRIPSGRGKAIGTINELLKQRWRG
jgi:hypothetical protein